MVDFAQIEVIKTKDGFKVGPEFLVKKSKDLMTQGGKFLAVWDEESNKWSTDDTTVKTILDRETRKECDNLRKAVGDDVKVTPLLLERNSSKKWQEWKSYVSSLSDNYKPLDRKIIFATQETTKEDYSTKRLPYDMCEGPIDAYDKIMSTLYKPEEREKIEWFIGAIISGDSKRLQKFLVLYGDKGTGKSTVLNIVESLFPGYCKSFNAKVLGLSNSSFALEAFRDNPLVAIEHDSDLSRIEDNTRLNSIISHEPMVVNEKFKSAYSSKFDAVLLVGSNKPVKITDAKSGLLRRLIDVTPTGITLPEDEYYILADKDNPQAQYKFELGAIAYHCLNVYNTLGFRYYSRYKPRNMMGETNEFYNFILDEYDFFEENKDYLLLKTAYKRYREYCDESNIRYPLQRMDFKNELKNYFNVFIEKTNGNSNVFRDFKNLYSTNVTAVKSKKETGWLKFDCEESLFDKRFADCPAQGCKEDGSPKHYWKNVKTRLCDIDTHELHWMKPPITVVCADFDLKDASGNKSLKLNMQAASKWIPTYAELSKSGCAIHLYYYYTGNVDELSTLFAPGIEIKTFPGNASLRRKLTKCNDIPIATISSGLPLKGEDKGDSVISWEGIKDEKHLIRLISKALTRKVHDDTSSNINFIKSKLDEAYNSGITYSIPQDMIDDIIAFAGNSTNQSDRCLGVVAEMHFKSKDIGDPLRDDEKEVKDDRIVFFDIEVYRPDKETNNPGLFLICWKYQGADNVSAMINPKPHDVEYLMSNFKLAGFNCRAYDNIMLWGASLGYSNERLYDLSQRIIVRKEKVFPEAANVSYVDVFDMCTDKMSLKKWEIRLGIAHKEMGIPWDEPAPLDRWEDIVDYCKNDVIATEAVFNARQGDFMARKIQVDLVKLLHPDEDIKVCINDTTNTLSKRIIFGRERKPQSEFNWRDMSKPVGSDQYEYYRERFGKDYCFRVFDIDGLPVYRDYIPGEVLPEGWSILPFFKGYECKLNSKTGKYESTYLGEKIGEGGRVYSFPGYYEWVWDGDISSQHPHSIIAECLFGPRYTKIFEEIVKARVAVKHHDFGLASSLLGGALKPYLKDEYAADLAQALKIVINSIYGLTSAKFDNEFRDSRNFDNIVAKRGANFMTLLKKELQRRSAFVCHIKTDSIKIPNASKEVKEFVIKFGREFGYEFETEAVFTKFALFNDAAYLGYTEDGEWITKADQFKEEKQPFLFKTLFSHKPYEFSDFCETKSVTEGALYLDMNETLGDPVDDRFDKELKKLMKMRESKDPAMDDKIIDQELLCERLRDEIPTHHNYVFVGRVGQFTPIIDGAGGGILSVKRDNGYSSASGSKGYRWLESEQVIEYGLQDKIDMSYYRKKVDKAREAIDKIVPLGVDYFISDQVPEKKTIDFFDTSFMNIPEVDSEEIPFDADYVA